MTSSKLKLAALTSQADDGVSQRAYLLAIIMRLFIDLTLLVGGMMVATWMRLNLPFGLELGSEYVYWPFELVLIMLAATALAYVLAFVSEQMPILRRFVGRSQRFQTLLIATGIACVLIYFVLPDFSQLQFIYFAPMTFIVGIFTIALPARLRRSAYRKTTFSQNMRELWVNVHLIRTWLGYRVASRYTQTFLGVMWIILLPLSQSLVMAFAFTQLLGARVGVGVPFVVFLLTGQVIFSIFQKTVLQTSSTIISMMGVMKQVYFPREIMVILVVGEALVDFLFTLIATVIIAAFFGIYPNIYYIFLPIPVLLMVTLGMAFAFIVGWVSLVIRDLQQLISVMIQLLFYTTVLYHPSQTSPQIEFIMSLNPLTAITQAFRAIMIEARPPDFVNLFVPAVLAFALLFYGYVYFKVNEDRLIDMQ